MNKFIVIVPLYNVEKWIKTNINSVLSQTYENYECYYIDDMSTDNSAKIIQEFESEKIKLIKNKEKKFALRNIVEAIEHANPDDEDIIVTLDGDDWLAKKEVFEILDKNYQDDTLMTYGTYIHYPDGLVPGNVVPYSKQVIENKSYREARWRASALRTFKYKLWKNINKEDLKDTDGNFYEMAWDLAIMFPMLEMADDRWKCIKDILYYYNLTNPINDHKKDRAKQIRLDMEIRRKKKYDRLEE